MRTFILLGLVACCVSGLELSESRLRSEFSDFQTKYGKVYASREEQEKRFNIFKENYGDLLKESRSSRRPYTVGVTQFSDLTNQEFKNTFLGLKHTNFMGQGNMTERRVSGDLPDSINWVEKGAVSSVKNQGQCGSCWAHSVTEQIESEFMLAGNAMWEFSVQQVNSCVKKCFGCGGGDTPAGYEYLMSLPKGEGLGSAAFAPYVQSMTEQCLGKRCTESCDDLGLDTLKTKSSLTGYYATVEDYSYATPGCTGDCANQNMTGLASAIAEHGPASICVNAANWGSYTGGVMTVDQCGGFAYGDLDHCVQLTGFNADAETPYWMVRNSWSTDWGNDGYIFLEFADNANPCGIANEATFVQLGENKGDNKDGRGK